MEHLGSKNETMAPLHVAPPHVATLTVKRELPKYEIILSMEWLYLTSVPRMALLHVATLTVKRATKI